MKFRLSKHFEEYFRVSDEIYGRSAKNNQRFIEVFHEFHSFYVNYVFGSKSKMAPLQAILAMNAFLLHQSSIKMTLSGHISASFPLFRTAVESAAYSYLVGTDRSLEKIWLERHESEDSMKLCRRTFIGAVQDAASRIGATEGAWSGTESWINEAYQSAIDFGTNPNKKSIFNHLSFSTNDDSQDQIVTLTALYEPEPHHFRTCMLACLDYGMQIFVILSFGLQESQGGLFQKLQELEELKNSLIPEDATKEAPPIV